MTDGVEPTSINRPWRVPLLGLIIACVVVVAAGSLWMYLAEPDNPYRQGTRHEATITNDEACANTWTVQLQSGRYHYVFRGTAPREWSPDGVPGTLTILDNWSRNGTDAEFEANGQTVNLRGGSDGGPHFFAEGCLTYAR